MKSKGDFDGFSNGFWTAKQDAMLSSPFFNNLWSLPNPCEARKNKYLATKNDRPINAAELDVDLSHFS